MFNPFTWGTKSAEALIKPANRSDAALALFIRFATVSSMTLMREMHTVTPSKVISEVRTSLKEQGVTIQEKWEKAPSGKRHKVYWLSDEDKRKLKASPND